MLSECYMNSINTIRLKKVPIPQFVFKCGTQAIKTIDRYTYLGVILDEHMHFFVLTLVTHLVTMTMTMTMTKFILKIKTSFEAYKRYIYVQI